MNTSKIKCPSLVKLDFGLASFVYTVIFNSMGGDLNINDEMFPTFKFASSF